MTTPFELGGKKQFLEFLPTHQKTEQRVFPWKLDAWEMILSFWEGNYSRASFTWTSNDK